MSTYSLGNPPIPSWGSDWGGIAEIALKGWCIRGQDGLLELTRAGPFVPPISLPESDMGRMIWEVVVTDDFKRLLEISGLSGFTFRPIRKRHIIRMEWEKWVLSEVEPPESFETHEPIDYFSSQPHDLQIASEIGRLWEMRLGFHAELEFGTGLVGWDGTDWFRVKDPMQATDYIYVSQKAKLWLQQIVPEWVTFGGDPRPRTEIIPLLRDVLSKYKNGFGKGYKMVNPNNSGANEHE